MSHSPLPTLSVIKTIEVLYSGCRRDVQDYYSVDWSNATIRFGQPLLERKLVNTVIPIVSIPRHIQDIAVGEFLFPLHTLHDHRINMDIRENMSFVSSMDFEAKMSLHRQISLIEFP